MAWTISPKTPSLRLEKLRAIGSGTVNWYDSPRIDGHKVDHFTASAIVQVYDALSPANREKFLALPVDRMAAMAWKLGRGRRRHPTSRSERRSQYHTHRSHPYSHPAVRRHRRR
jgi:hypothetical protein